MRMRELIRRHLRIVGPLCGRVDVDENIRRLKSSSGNEYLGVTVCSNLTRAKRRLFRLTVGKSEFKRMVDNKRKRDGHIFHITVVAPKEFSLLGADQFEKIEGRKCVFLLKTLGIAETIENKAYFIIVESKTAAVLRTMVGLPGRDFHITLGFDPDEAHGVPKDDTASLEIVTER